MIIWRKGLTWITKDTNTHSQYVIVIAFPLQQWLQEHTCMLRYVYTAYPVNKMQTFRNLKCRFLKAVLIS